MAFAGGDFPALIQRSMAPGVTFRSWKRLIRELSNFSPADAEKLITRANQLRLAQGKQRVTIENIRAAMATESGSVAVREQQVREVLRRFERIADELSKVSIGWGDVGPTEIKRIRTALAHIAALSAKHLQSVPREFLDDDTGEDPVLRQCTPARFVRHGRG